MNHCNTLPTDNFLRSSTGSRIKGSKNRITIINASTSSIQYGQKKTKSDHLLMNDASTTTNNAAAANATNTHHSGTTATASTGETKSSASSPTTPTSSTTKSAVAKVSARFPQTSFKTSTAPAALPSQAVVRPVPALRSSSVRREWKWIPVQVETSEEIWIFLHPVDKNHQVCVCASPSSTEIPSLLVQPELISLEYKKQRGISRNRGHLEQHWIRIYSYLQPSFPQRIGMRCLCRLFDAVERLTTENYSRHSTLMLMPIPSGVWTTFPHASHDTLGDLVEWVNGVVEESPGNGPQLLFLQEGAPDEYDGEDDYESLSEACVVVDETGCFRLTGDNVTDDDVVRVAREYSNLESLNLECCSNITDASVMEVARRCSNLQTLNLRCCSNITSACKNALRQSHPKLQLY